VIAKIALTFSSLAQRILAGPSRRWLGGDAGDQALPERARATSY
jgi:hypothetical protein